MVVDDEEIKRRLMERQKQPPSDPFSIISDEKVRMFILK